MVAGNTTVKTMLQTVVLERALGCTHLSCGTDKAKAIVPVMIWSSMVRPKTKPFTNYKNNCGGIQVVNGVGRFETVSMEQLIADDPMVAPS